MKPKVSFLIPAHNEEKIIGKTLKNLINLPYKDYEIIIGLDGCTDKTEDIVKEFKKKFRKIKYYKLNLRQGKPAVIDKIIKYAKGELIIINDADWIFSVRGKESLEKFISVFDNLKIGGIAESFPVEWQEDKLKKGNLGFKIVAYSSFFWLQFLKERFSYKKQNLRILKKPIMFLTNIFRKKLYKKNFSLADDPERTKNIMDSGYNVVVFDDMKIPRMLAAYDKILLRDLFKQKIRTAMAREQIKKQQGLNLNYYISATCYIFKNSWKKGFGIGLMISFWIFLNFLAIMFSKFKKIDTKEGWKLRAKR